MVSKKTVAERIWLHGYMATWLLEGKREGKGRKTLTGSNYAGPLVAS